MNFFTNTEESLILSESNEQQKNIYNTNQQNNKYINSFLDSNFEESFYRQNDLNKKGNILEPFASDHSSIIEFEIKRSDDDLFGEEIIINKQSFHVIQTRFFEKFEIPKQIENNSIKLCFKKDYGDVVYFLVLYGKLPILINEKNVFDEKIFTGVWKLLLKLENKKFFSGDLSCDMDKSNNSNDKLKIDEKLAFNMKKKSECLFWNNKEQRISYDNRKYYFYNFFQLLSFPIQMWPLAQRTIFVETNYERIMKNNFLCMTHSGYKSKNIQEYEYMANKNKNNNVFCMINTNNKKTSSIINETLSIMISENNKKKKMKII